MNTEEFAVPFYKLARVYPQRGDLKELADAYFDVLGPCFTARQWALTVSAALAPHRERGESASLYFYEAHFRYMPTPAELLVLGGRVASAEGDPAQIAYYLSRFGEVTHANEIRAALISHEDGAMQLAVAAWKRRLRNVDVEHYEALHESLRDDTDNVRKLMAESRADDAAKAKRAIERATKRA